MRQLSYHLLGMFSSHSPWIHWTGKGLEFTGKVGHTEGLDEWAAGPGAPIVADVVTSLSVIGLGSKETRAKDKIVGSLSEVFKASESLSTAVDNFAASFPTRFAALVDDHWDVLPHSSASELRFVPMFYLNAQEKRRWAERVANASELEAVVGGTATIDFFLGETARQTTSAFAVVAPQASVKDKPIDKPYQTGEKWLIGYDPQYVWVSSSDVIDQPGHFYVYSSPGSRSSAKGKDAKESKRDAAALLLATKDWLGTLTAEERATISSGLAV
jgi:hypothetical protein